MAKKKQKKIQIEEEEDKNSDIAKHLLNNTVVRFSDPINVEKVTDSISNIDLYIYTLHEAITIYDEGEYHYTPEFRKLIETYRSYGVELNDNLMLDLANNVYNHNKEEHYISYLQFTRLSRSAPNLKKHIFFENTYSKNRMKNSIKSKITIFDKIKNIFKK